jgi:transcriptional regulator with XRE-family HTH domain
MFSKKELFKSPEFWLEKIQNDIYFEVLQYMKDNDLNQSKLAKKLGFSKGYISQVLNGNFNYSLRKLIKLSLAINKAPKVEFQELDSVVDEMINESENTIGNNVYIKNDNQTNRGMFEIYKNENQQSNQAKFIISETANQFSAEEYGS